ncbi:winged helix DNA-binding domain-containing protein [Brevibacterium sp. RIT 803]|uniref:winged helix DNA-binding domain-containing protein n=1 Tax=Brevibacterium sp. RIT 803 TaxID=2810210 RepID=UPI00194F6B6E|nr:winged helix DNA-binding domain-containing protein [Brevibacterium sp. RIT 803]MBM6590062.1 AlkZ family DNA glycosylase [Brevibacterium sp. RIT 803]
MDSHQVSAARLISQGLIDSARSGNVSAYSVVRDLGCVQAQALGGALVSIALRTGSSVAAVREAMDSGHIIRTWTQRGTIHLAAAADLGWILGLTGQRTLDAVAKRREVFGIDDAMVDAAAQLAEEAIRARGPLTRQELLDAFAPLEAGKEYGHERYLITTLALRNIIAQGPMVEGKDDMKYVLTGDWIPNPVELDAEAALHEWMRRYVLSHGPVTIDDAARWTGLPKTPVRKAIAAAVAGGEIVEVRIEDREHYQSPELDDRLHETQSQTNQLLLLPGFDEIILGYKDRSATLDPAHEKLVVPGGNGMFKNTLIDGAKARATWKRSPRKTGPRLIIDPFGNQAVDHDRAEAVAASHPAFA